jgi:SnoaL-like protein
MAIERAPELEKLAEETFEAYKRGDIEAIERTTSRHESSTAVGTDPTEVWHGFDEIIENLRTEIASQGEEAGFESVQIERRGYREGDTGWVSIEGKFRLADGTEIPTRGLAVLHREDGEWKYVHYLYSVAVPNSALEAGSPIAEALSGATR